MAPGMKGPGILEYKAAHNLIRAHAKAYRVYQNEFAESQQGKNESSLVFLMLWLNLFFNHLGKVGITLNVNWFEPLVFNDTEHIEACETKLQFSAGWFANPIFVNGKYPEIMRQKV